MAGMLYLCATPIGNLEDITLRVIRTLKEVDLIACEDTRNSVKLFHHYDIETPYTSYHEHNKFDKGKVLINMLLEGKDIAVVTDAGTPAISDPGEELVRMCSEEGIKVTSLPGASAFVTALTLSGISADRFAFEGFIPTDNKKRKKRMESIKEDTRTLLFYEAPHRLKQTLKVLMEYLGDRDVSIVREITKRYETVFHTTIAAAIEYYKDNEPRGEYVLVVKGKDELEIEEENKEKWQTISLDEHMEIYLSKGLDKKEAMKAVAKDRGKTKREIYKELLG
ncbi:MAG: 16S rRNA (cytidine(1402)-2'-O)-methyltransferase [Suipraeoptans sp.]